MQKLQIMNNTIKKPAADKTNIAVLLVFFVILPVFLFNLGLDFVLEKIYRQRSVEYSQQIRRNLMTVRSEGDNERYLQKQLNFMYGRLSEEIIRPETIQGFLDKFRARGFDFVNFRFFDANRKHIAIKGESKKYQAFIRKIFSALSQPETEGESELLGKYRSFFMTFLGVNSPADLVYEKSSLVDVSLNGAPGFFYWNTIYSHLEGGKFKGGLIAFFEKSAVSEDLAVKSLLYKLNQESGSDTCYGFLDSNELNRSYLPEKLKRIKGLTPKGISSQISGMRKKLETEAVYKGVLFNTLQLDAQRDLFCLQLIREKSFDYGAFLLRIFVFISVLIILRLILDFRLSGELPQILRKRKAVLTVAYLVCFPLAAFVVVGCMQVSTFYRMERQSIYGRLENHINSIDENYNVAVKQLEKNYLKLGENIVGAGFRPERISDLCRELKDRNELRKLFILDKEGRIEFSWPRAESHTGNDLLKKLVPAIGARLIANFTGQKHSLRSRINDMVFDSISKGFSELVGGDDGLNGLLKAFEKTEKVTELWFANKRYYVYSKFLLPTSDLKDVRLMFIWNDSGAFSQRYLKKQVENALDSRAGLQNIRLAMMSRSRTIQPFPKEFTKYPFSQIMLEQVLATEAKQSSDEELDGRNWLVTASPLKRIPDSILFAMLPLTEVEEEFRRMVFTLFAVVVCCLMMSVFAAKKLF
jgi:hypothetical protein